MGIRTKIPTKSLWHAVWRLSQQDSGQLLSLETYESLDMLKEVVMHPFKVWQICSFRSRAHGKYQGSQKTVNRCFLKHMFTVFLKAHTIKLYAMCIEAH